MDLLRDAQQSHLLTTMMGSREPRRRDGGTQTQAAGYRIPATGNR